MILESELKKLKDLVNQLIESTAKEINSLKNLSGIELIKNEKILADTLNKLVKLTIDINKSFDNKNDFTFLNEEDEKIIEQFYQNYHLQDYDKKRQKNPRSNIKK
jgi:hypothetical protein